MRDVPKFVLKRLEESAGAETHPDADLLTGFVEKTLLESERNRVMEHLVRCSACRETVALALPVSEYVASEGAAAITSLNPTRNSWFNWAAVGWVAATVGIVAITSIGIRHYWPHKNDTSNIGTSNRVLMSRNEMSPAPAYPTTSPPQASPDSESLKSAPHEKNGEGANSSRKAQPNRQEHFSAAPLNRLSKQQAPSPHAGHAAAAAGRTASVAAGSAGAQSARVPEPAPSPNVAQGAGVPPDSQAVAAESVEVESEAATVTAKSGKKVSGQSVKKKEVVDEQSSKNFADGSAPPQWTISSEGALQRSLDAGQTWVNVNPGQEIQQSTEAEITENARAFNKSGAKQSAQKKNGETKNDARSNPVFRAVAAFDKEVWAGGSAAMLYHSSDSGVHWARIAPFASGAMLTGDISSIDFSDSQHGAITTSTGEVWITADGGRTWLR